MPMMGKATEPMAPKPPAMPAAEPLVSPAPPNDRMLPTVPMKPAGAEPNRADPMASKPPMRPAENAPPPSRLVGLNMPPRFPNRPPPPPVRLDTMPPAPPACAVPVPPMPMVPMRMRMGLAMAAAARSASSRKNRFLIVSPKSWNAFLPSLRML